MKMKSAALISMLLLVLPVFAETDRVIIATDITSVDALVAKAAGDKAGAPVLIAENGSLTADMKDQLSSLNAKTVILVGGPQVISAAAAGELQSIGYNVIRLWGMERTGTAIEVAKYFWTEGSNCTVIADDTKNSGDDTGLQTQASSLASESGCPMIPMPKGAVPAEVLAMLSDMNVSEIKFVARSAPDGTMFAKFKMKAITGGNKEIEAEVEKEIESFGKLKLVIVAVPDWRQGLGVAAHPSERSVVRFVSNVSQVPDLIGKIKEKNITDVRIVGVPALAQEIASLLNQSGIEVKVVSGEKAHNIGKKLVEEFKEKWAEKKRKFEDRSAQMLARMKAKLLERINETEEKLNDYEIELQSLKEDGAPETKIAEIQAKIDFAKTKISSLKADLQSNNVDYTIRELAKAMEVVSSKRWESRMEIKIDVRERLANEERGYKEMEKVADITEMENKMAAMKARCTNVQALEDLVSRAKSLRDEAKNALAAGDHANASVLVVQAKKVVEAAKHVGNVCEKSAKISDKVRNAAAKRVEHAKVAEAKIVKRVKAVTEKTSSPEASASP